MRTVSFVFEVFTTVVAVPYRLAIVLLFILAAVFVVYCNAELVKVTRRLLDSVVKSKIRNRDAW